MRNKGTALPPFMVQKRAKTTVWHKIGIGVAIVLCAIWVFGSGSIDTAPTYTPGDGYAANSIGDAEYQRVVIGDSLTSIKNFLGDPESAQPSSFANGNGGVSNSTCIYYNGLNGRTGVYQFCFSNGTLTSKAKY